MELASCQPCGLQNYETDPTASENLCTLGLKWRIQTDSQSTRTYMQTNHFNITILLAFTIHLQVSASSVLRFRDHTQWHDTVGRTPQDEWSARRRDIFLTNTQHSQQTEIHAHGGIRTRNLRRRAAADPRLRQLGHWDRLVISTYFNKIRQSSSGSLYSHKHISTK